MVSTLPSAPNDPLFGSNHFTPIRWVLAGLVALSYFWLTTTGMAYTSSTIHHPSRLVSHTWLGAFWRHGDFDATIHPVRWIVLASH